ncbi:hypothetical protein TrRE_jg8742 [Triparma retinervis]|uniref:Uncharacterized protein n=1 Tax=Triparma retinervis TaxID=2557542 RepID=A0A9W6ZXH0_9STRA|nr:hypothetical protein TrRE_jg8742 [Triparma retinervis]
MISTTSLPPRVDQLPGPKPKWWGDNLSDPTTFQPAVHALGKVSHPAGEVECTFPILAADLKMGAKMMSNYLRDMGHLALTVYEGRHPCLSGSNIPIAELNASVVFELGPHGDTPNSRVPSRLITRMPGSMSKEIDSPATRAPLTRPNLADAVTEAGGTVVTSFQLKEAIAHADEGAEELRTWPEKNGGQSYRPPEGEGVKVVGGAIGMEVGGTKIGIKTR